MDFAVRRGHLADALAVSACIDAAYARWVPIIGTKPSPMLADYAETLQRERVYVLEMQARIVGVLVLCAADEGFLLESVAVHPDFAGRGLGAFLLSLAEQEARTRGYASLYLYTHELMAANIVLYRKLGYVEYARRVEQGFRRIYMRKTLE